MKSLVRGIMYIGTRRNTVTSF